MDFKFTQEQEDFRQEVREFLKAELEQGSFTIGLNSFIEACSPEFSRKLAKKGWIGITWPTEFGGQGRPYVDRTILMEELMKVQAPLSFHFFSDRQVGPALIHFGSEAQKKEFLPKIIQADISFCLGFSETEAGSDLVAVRTTAEDKGDYYLLNGQKVWTSGAHTAHYGWFLTRTSSDPDVPRHSALSEFIVDMKSPGITVRPIINMAGVHSFNEIFLEDVMVPKENLVGEKDKGFYQIMAQMDYERAGIERLMQNYPVYEYFLNYIKTTKKNGAFVSKDPIVRKTVAELEIEYNIGRLLCYRVAWTIDQGKIPNYEAATCKVFCTRYEQKLSDTATRLLGLYGQLLPGCKWAPFDGLACESFLWSPCYTIQGGSSEILKNIIALRGLKLQTK